MDPKQSWILAGDNPRQAKFHRPSAICLGAVSLAHRPCHKDKRHAMGDIFHEALDTENGDQVGMAERLPRLQWRPLARILPFAGWSQCSLGWPSQVCAYAMADKSDQSCCGAQMGSDEAHFFTWVNKLTCTKASSAQRNLLRATKHQLIADVFVDSPPRSKP